MTDTSWLTDNWPWWGAFFFLVSYEVYALVTHKPTLSKMVWRSTNAYPWVVPIAFTFLSVLVPHFWIPGVAGYVWAGLLTASTWYVYFLLRKRADNG